MSMHAYPVFGYGLYLNDDEAKAFAEEYGKRQLDIDDADVSDVCFDLDSTLLSDSEPIDGWDVTALDGEHEYGEYAYGLFLYSEHQGSVFSGSPELYADGDEMADEFREAFGEFLPDGFDIKAHLTFFKGTIEA